MKFIVAFLIVFIALCACAAIGALFGIIWGAGYFVMQVFFTAVLLFFVAAALLVLLSIADNARPHDKPTEVKRVK